MELRTVTRIRKLSKQAENLRGFFDYYKEKISDSSCDKHKAAFNEDSRFSNFSVKASFDSALGYYGNSGCSTAGPSIDNKDAEEYLTRALNQHKEQIFQTMADLMQKDAAAMRSKAEEELKEMSEMLESVDAEQGDANQAHWNHESNAYDIIACRLAGSRNDEPVAAVNHSDSFLPKGAYKIFSYDDEYLYFYPRHASMRHPKAWGDPCWQLLYPGKVYAQAPERLDAADFTPLKCYEVIKEEGGSGRLFWAYNDNGDKSVLCWCGETDARLPRGANWTRIIPENL